MQATLARGPARLGGVLAAGLACAALAAGCGGSSTKTVSVASSPAETETSTTSTTGTHTAAHTATTSTASTAPSTSTSTQATRTASAPAFTHQGGSVATSQGAAATAAAVVRAHGYTPNDTSQYHPNQTLTVLVGTRSGSGDGYDQQAFFFLGGRYIGTDTAQPSASVKVVSQGETEVTLAYPLYHAHDPLCCPSGGSATVNFQLNNGKLTPLQSIPPASSETGLSRQ
jgi:hypothetical protein